MPEPAFQSAAGQPPDDAVPSWWFIFRGSRLLVSREGGSAKLPCGREPGELGLPLLRRQCLGSLGDELCYTAEVADSLATPPGWAFEGLRRLYGALPEALFWVAGRAIQIIDWDRTHQYCGRCGAPMGYKPDERAKECPACGLISYPRISPAVIVMVERDGRLLLARSHRHPAGFYSVLAGFVEPGETLEEAVRREVREEVSLEVADIRYFGSQPWPFPNSLMIAFTCRHDAGEIRLDLTELEDAGWYGPTDLPNVPPPPSIARQLIELFIARHSA